MKAAPRILFVGNFLTRHWGRGRTGIDMRLMAGAIRNDWPALSFSERDIARFLAPLGFLRTVGAAMMNTRLVATAKNWKPDVVFVSHCDYVTNATLAAIRRAVPGVRIAHLNCDPVETAHCRAQIARRVDSCDAIFVTTAGAALEPWKTAKNVVGFFPNPSDPAYEVEDNSAKTDFAYDLFFAGRPALADARQALLDDLLPRLAPSVRLGLFGMGKALVVGRAYEEAIAASKMGLSINRFENWKWYASDRITHLMANGVLAFQYDGNQMQDFFSAEETVYFHTAAELAEKIAFYQAHDGARRAVAAAGRAAYRRLFDARRVLKCLVEATLGEPFSEAYEWAGEVHRERNGRF
ncbi:MAG: glycosyltransferase [Kiritimatiellia bacterium]